MQVDYYQFSLNECQKIGKNTSHDSRGQKGHLQIVLADKQDKIQKFN